MFAWTRLPFLAFVASLASGAITPDVPIVDISSFASGAPHTKHDIANAVGHAFSEFGFVVITGHGVSHEAFEDAYDAAKLFFRQPLDEKRLSDLGKGYGYGGYLNKMETGGQLSGQNVTRSDGVESLTLRGLQHLAASEEVCAPHFAQDMSDVPRADPVPSFPPSLQPNVAKLHAALFDFKDVMTTIAEFALGVPAGVFHNLFDPAKGGVRFAYYPELSESPRTDHVDYGAHADSASMVFLWLDPNNPAGTEIMYKGRWLPVPTVPGGIVVNLGTVLSRLTGGRWHAAVHRATRSSRTERMSLVLGALVPNNELTLQCLPRLCGDQPGTRRQILVKEYLDARTRLQRPEKSPGDEDVVNFIDDLA